MLQHIRVLDLSDERGQLCGLMLAMLGAEVLAVEPPGGSRSRRIGPFVDGATGDPERSLFHWSFNRGKGSITLDLTENGGRAELLSLAAGADVLIESGGAGAIDDLGLSPDTLAKINPALVVASISAFGQNGPKARWQESDLIVAAAAGVLALTGNEDRAPLRISLPQAYHHAAIDAACGVMAALHDRQNGSGLGQYLDISAQQSFSVATQSFMLNERCGTGASTRVAGGVRLSGLDTKIQLLWPCKDGQVSVTFLFGAALGPFTKNLMDWIFEEGFCDEATRDKDWVLYANMLFDGTEPISEYERIKLCVGDFLATKTKDELLAASFARRVLIAPVTTAADVANSEHWQARGFWDEVETSAGTVRFPGTFAKFSGAPLAPLAAAPALGADTAAVAAEPVRSLAVTTKTPINAEPALPLAGLKVADFTWVFAGPCATRMMADLGAEVMRVESSRSLDALRTTGNFQDDNTDPDWAIQFSNMNAGKYGTTLDLGDPASKDLVHDMVRWADVTLESFSPKAMVSWGYDYESLKKIRPDLIMASSCLMGQTGPHRFLAGFGTMAAAISGFFNITGWPDRAPCGPFMAYTDYVSPRFLLTAVLAALEHRRMTGQGQHVDLSQAEASMLLQAPAILEYTVNDRVMERAGNDDQTMAPHGVYPVSGNDRWLAIAVADDGVWRTLCGLMNRSDLAPLASTERLASRRTLDDELAAWTAGQNGEELMNQLQDAGVAAHIVQNSAEVIADPQLVHRNHFVQVPHEAMGTTWIENSRLHLSRTPAVVERGAPTLGQHTWEILTEILGYEADKAAELIGSGIFE